MSEIERKFLVERHKMPMPSAGVEIRQGYVALDPQGTEVRVREKGGVYFLTVKSDGAMERQEGEIRIDEKQFETLWDFAKERSIEKMRYHIPLGRELTCELDIFEGDLKGLIVAEVEFSSLAAAADFEPPAWFGLEVTDDARYKNKNLAVRGLV